MKKQHVFGILGLVCLALLSGCAERPVGSEKRPFTMYFVPSVDAESIASGADDLTGAVSKYVSQKLYGKDTGFHIKSAVPTSYIAVVEAFGTKKADFAAFNTFSYILAKDIKKYPIEALLTIIRGHGETTYKGQIIVHADSSIKSIEDLKGKKFAYTDPASTAGFILPSQLFKEKGIKLGEVVFAQKHDNVVTMVYQKQVDAGATYYSVPIDGKIRDARERVLTQFPDVEQKVRIIGFTQDIPNEPWVIRSDMFKDEGMNSKVKQYVREALLEYSKSENGKKVLKAVYNVTGLAPGNDDSYHQIRKIVSESDIKVEELAGKK